jgi:hypothetical protein
LACTTVFGLTISISLSCTSSLKETLAEHLSDELLDFKIDLGVGELNFVYISLGDTISSAL